MVFHLAAQAAAIASINASTTTMLLAARRRAAMIRSFEHIRRIDEMDAAATPPITRTYSLSEIVEMRGMVQRLLTEYGVPYNRLENNFEIESQLRTYMAAGVDPSAIRAAVSAKEEEDRQHQISVQEWLEQSRAAQEKEEDKKQLPPDVDSSAWTGRTP